MTAPGASEARPLRGRRIVVTRPEAQAVALVQRLRELGAVVIACPTIAIRPPAHWAPLDEAIRDVDLYDWIVFTSSNAVRSVIDRQLHTGRIPGAFGRARVAAVGDATRRALLTCGVAPACVPARFTSAALVVALGEVRDLRLLLPRSDVALAALPVALRAEGAQVHEVIAYRTVAADGLASMADRCAREAMDAIVFTSPSTARNFLRRLRASGVLDGERAQGARPAIICIGPTTAGAVRELAGALAVDAVAERHDDDGLVDAIVGWSGANARAADA